MSRLVPLIVETLMDCLLTQPEWLNGSKRLNRWNQNEKCWDVREGVMPTGKEMTVDRSVPQEIQFFTEEIQYERVGIVQGERYPAKSP